MAACAATGGQAPRRQSSDKSPFHAAAEAVAARSHALAAVAAAALLLGCAGGCVFRWLERDAELSRYALNRAIYTSLVESVDFEHCHDIAFKNIGYCKQHAELELRLRTFFERAGNSVADLCLWTWLGSFFFVFNLSSTVGYATQGAPATAGGQLAAVLFGLAGVPLFGCAVVLASGPLASGATATLRGCRPLAINAGVRPRTLQAAACVLLVGLLWFGAALLFQVMEGWSYPRALFFCFMTISTVGIGADVPATPAGRALCMVYIFLALGTSWGLLRLASRRAGEDSIFAVVLNKGSDERHVQARQRLLLACSMVLLLLCLGGGLVFPKFERAIELGRYDKSRDLFADLNALAKFKGCDEEVVGRMDFCRNVRWFREHLVAFFGPHTVNSMVDRGHWTVMGSFAFALSVASTIGYGTQSPQTREGKVVTVVFGALAIPAFACCAFICASNLRATARRWCEKAAVSVRDLTPLGRGGDSPRGPLVGPLGELVILVLGLWLAGAVAFCSIEGWGFPQSLYFCFVTLSAVGFANVTPQTFAGRVVIIGYIGVGLASAASLASEVVDRMVAAFGVEDEEDSDDDEQGLLSAAPAAAPPRSAAPDAPSGC